MQKVLVERVGFPYTLGMTNNTTAPEFDSLYGQPVILLSVERSEYGMLAFVQFEDGREEEVPLSAIDLLD